MCKRIHVIINPAAGKNQPILNTLNRIFQATDIDWEVSITKKSGDTRRFAQAAINSEVDVVAVYGGDGTVSEAVNGIIGSDMPLGILPGGTGNALADELNIPRELDSACTLVCNYVSGKPKVSVSRVDVGQINEHHFLLRAGIGYDVEVIKKARRDQKDRFGVLAYPLGALSALSNANINSYTLTLDGREVEVEGLTCIIINSGAIGWSGLKLAYEIDTTDGQLDVIIVQDANLRSLLSLAASVIGNDTIEAIEESANLNNKPFHHWQVREVTVVADPVQEVHCDGEFIGIKTPITARICPHAINVIVPEYDKIIGI